MFDALEAFRGRAAHALAGGIRRDQPGKFLLQIEQLLIKPVVFAVADLRLGEHVVGMVVRADFLDQFGVPGFGFVERHCGIV